MHLIFSATIQLSFSVFPDLNFKLAEAQKSYQCWEASGTRVAGVGGWGGGSGVCSSLEWSALSLWPKTHPPTPLPSSLLLPISSSSARSGPLGSLFLNDTSLLDLNGSPHLTVDRCAAGSSPPIALLIRRLWTASGSLFPVFLSTSVHHTAPYYWWSF